jgi:hypothetical protein
MRPDRGQRPRRVSAGPKASLGRRGGRSGAKQSNVRHGVRDLKPPVPAQAEGPGRSRLSLPGPSRHLRHHRGGFRDASGAGVSRASAGTPASRETRSWQGGASPTASVLRTLTTRRRQRSVRVAQSPFPGRIRPSRPPSRHRNPGLEPRTAGLGSRRHSAATGRLCESARSRTSDGRKGTKASCGSWISVVSAHNASRAFARLGRAGRSLGRSSALRSRRRCLRRDDGDREANCAVAGLAAILGHHEDAAARHGQCRVLLARRTGSRLEGRRANRGRRIDEANC